jgi:hypothetical protein
MVQLGQFGRDIILPLQRVLSRGETASALNFKITSPTSCVKENSFKQETH